MDNQPAQYSIDPKSKLPQTIEGTTGTGVTPVPPQQPIQPPAVGAQSWFSRNRSAIIIIIILSIIVVGTISKLILMRNGPKPEAPAPSVVVVTPIVSPTPIRQPSALASQSAFIKFDADVSSLLQNVQAYSVEDPSLSPPILDLPLGFSN